MTYTPATARDGSVTWWPVKMGRTSLYNGFEKQCAPSACVQSHQKTAVKYAIHQSGIFTIIRADTTQTY